MKNIFIVIPLVFLNTILLKAENLYSKINNVEFIQIGTISSTFSFQTKNFTTQNEIPIVFHVVKSLKGILDSPNITINIEKNQINDFIPFIGLAAMNSKQEVLLLLKRTSQGFLLNSSSDWILWPNSCTDISNNSIESIKSMLTSTSEDQFSHDLSLQLSPILSSPNIAERKNGIIKTYSGVFFQQKLAWQNDLSISNTDDIVQKILANITDGSSEVSDEAFNLRHHPDTDVIVALIGLYKNGKYTPVQLAKFDKLLQFLVIGLKPNTIAENFDTIENSGSQSALNSALRALRDPRLLSPTKFINLYLNSTNIEIKYFAYSYICKYRIKGFENPESIPDLNIFTNDSAKYLTDWTKKIQSLSTNTTGKL